MQNSVEEISFFYVRIDHILQPKIIDDLKKFKKLKNFIFQYNGCDSMKEITMLDKIMKLIDIRDRFDAITIENAFKQTIKKNENLHLKPLDTNYLTGSILLKNNKICEEPTFKP